MKGYEGDSCGECGNFHAGAQRDLHEMHDLRRDQRLFVSRTMGLPL